MHKCLLVLAVGLVATTAQAQPPEEIQTVQEALADYDPGNANGVMSEQTRAAIRGYQEDWRIPVTGTITLELIERLTGEHPATIAQWYRVDDQDCEVWNSFPAAQETIKWSGGCVDGKVDGSGVLTRNFVANGEAKQATYEGDLLEGKLHGHGIYLFANGGRFEGEYSDSKRHGRGILTNADGTRYDGEWYQGNRHGQGALAFTDGTSYEGEFRGDKLHGDGVYTFADGTRYEGGFHADLFNGEGVLVFANGNRYDGEFRQDKKHGQGVFIYAGGNRYEGEFRDDFFNGQGVLILANGNRYEGIFRDGRPHGQGIGIGADGTRFSGEDGCLTSGSFRWAVGRSEESCGF